MRQSETAVARHVKPLCLSSVLLTVALLVSAPALAQSGPMISAVAAVDQDGCPFCCEFSCRADPTPTPAFDAQGRPILQRETGRFLFVVEAGPGANGRAPSPAGVSQSGTIAPLLANGLPGLQALVNRALGNGSSFVECNTNIVGGVPAVPALDFGPETSTRNAMIDQACRYQWTNSSGPCTRDRFGGFTFLASGTTLQYCFEVPISAAFPLGDTIVALRIADSTGAVGPTREVVVRVGDAPPTPTPTATPVLRALSGQIALFNGTQAVAGVEMLLNGTAEATTDGQGSYSLAAASGINATLRPHRDGGLGAAVSALDASYVLQAIVGGRSLSTAQRLACDVSGDGTISTWDASLILQYLVGATTVFPVRSLCGGDWGFIPLAAAAPNQTVVQPSTNGTSCQNGEIRYQPLVADASGQHFLAVAYGDCTGNWTPAGAGAAVLQANGTGGLRLGRWRRRRGGSAKVPVFVDRPFQSAVIEIDYAERAWRARPVRKLASLGPALLQVRDDGTRLRIAIAAASPIDTADRPLLVLAFAPEQRRRLGTPIVTVTAVIDEQ